MEDRLGELLDVREEVGSAVGHVRSDEDADAGIEVVVNFSVDTKEPLFRVATPADLRDTPIQSGLPGPNQLAAKQRGLSTGILSLPDRELAKHVRGTRERRQLDTIERQLSEVEPQAVEARGERKWEKGCLLRVAGKLLPKSLQIIPDLRRKQRYVTVEQLGRTEGDIFREPETSTYR